MALKHMYHHMVAPSPLGLSRSQQTNYNRALELYCIGGAQKRINTNNILHQSRQLGINGARHNQGASKTRMVTVDAAPTPAVTGFWPVVVQAWHSDPAALLLGAGTSLLAVAVSILLIAAVPALLALRRTMLAMETLIYTVEEEVPDTAASLRLSGLEIADCVEEVTALGNDLSEGIRASARMIVGAERGIKEGISLAGRTVTDQVLPAVKKSAPKALGSIEAALQERAKLDHTEPTITELARATKTAAQQVRSLMAAASVANSATYHIARRVKGRRRTQGGKAQPTADVLGSLEGA